MKMTVKISYEFFADADSKVEAIEQAKQLWAEDLPHWDDLKKEIIEKSSQGL